MSTVGWKVCHFVETSPVKLKAAHAQCCRGAALFCAPRSRGRPRPVGFFPLLSVSKSPPSLPLSIPLIFLPATRHPQDLESEKGENVEPAAFEPEASEQRRETRSRESVCHEPRSRCPKPKCAAQQPCCCRTFLFILCFPSSLKPSKGGVEGGGV